MTPCAWCGGQIHAIRSDAITCSQPCRQARNRAIHRPARKIGAAMAVLGLDGDTDWSTDQLGPGLQALIPMPDPSPPKRDSSAYLAVLAAHAPHETTDRDGSAWLACNCGALGAITAHTPYFLLFRGHLADHLTDLEKT